MWPDPQEIADLVTFTQEILDGKFHFWCSVKLYRKLPTRRLPEESQINQLVSFTHDKHISFGQVYEKIIFFRDISKAFDKMWHAELLFRLEKDFILDKISRIMTFQGLRVVLNYQSSLGEKVQAWVSLSFIHSLLFF